MDDKLRKIDESLTLEFFKKMDLRIGEVLLASMVPGSRKLMKLEIDLGSERRTILSGIRPEYTPGEVIGMQVVVFCNLESKRLMGMESQGMVLDAGYMEGLTKPALLTVNHRVPNGVKVA